MCTGKWLCLHQHQKNRHTSGSDKIGKEYLLEMNIQIPDRSLPSGVTKVSAANVSSPRCLSPCKIFQQQPQYKKSLKIIAVITRLENYVKGYGT